jgi:hypothetical protein
VVIGLVLAAALLPPIGAVLFALFFGPTGLLYAVLVVLFLLSLLLSYLAGRRLAAPPSTSPPSATSPAAVAKNLWTAIFPFVSALAVGFLLHHGEIAWLTDEACQGGWVSRACALKLGADASDAQIYQTVALDLQIGWGSRTPEPSYDRCEWTLEVDGKAVSTADLPANGPCDRDQMHFYVGRDLFTPGQSASEAKVRVSVRVADGPAEHDIGSAETPPLTIADRRSVTLKLEPQPPFYRSGESVAVTAMVSDPQGNPTALASDLDPAEVCTLAGDIDRYVSRTGPTRCQWTVRIPSVAAETTVAGQLEVRLANAPSRDVSGARLTLTIRPDEITLPVLPEVVWEDERTALSVEIKDLRPGEVWLCDWSPPEIVRDSARRPCFNVDLVSQPSFGQTPTYVTKVPLQLTVKRKVDDGEIVVAERGPATVSLVRTKRPQLSPVDNVIVGERREFEVTLDPDRPRPQDWSCQISERNGLIRIDGSGCRAAIQGVSVGQIRLRAVFAS